MARIKTGRLEQALAHFHQFVAEIAEALISFGVFMQVFWGEVGNWSVQYSFQAAQTSLS
jgi:hypothetical protein